MRDVMDSPELLTAEWAKSDMISKIDQYYDCVWAYGPDYFWNPLKGFDLPETLSDKLTYTGFIHRELPSLDTSESHNLPDKYILVTGGGGGDGGTLMEQILVNFHIEGEVKTASIAKDLEKIVLFVVIAINVRGNCHVFTHCSSRDQKEYSVYNQ